LQLARRNVIRHGFDVELVTLPDGQVSSRCEAKFRSQQVWIEWKEYDSEHQNPEWDSIIARRVKTLVALLSSPQKSPYFNVPHCLGYFQTEGSTPDITRYGLVYQKPQAVAQGTPFTTLYSEFLSHPKPSLTQRIALAHTIAQSLMYLHSVNWLHKGLRSNNILFFLPQNTSGRQSYSSPILSGFEYSRVDLVDEYTELIPEHSEHDIYRHPHTLSSVHLRSKKSHDIYSLGLILVEIAHWRRIHDIVHLPQDERQAKKIIRNLRATLLKDDSVMEMEGLVGDSYSQAVIACLEGLVGPDADEENPQVGVKIQKAFHDRVVAKLSAVSV
jgi:serine/threonine protein kinase